jgi:hypothetical protein
VLARQHVAQRGARQAGEVHRAMFVKPRIFDRQQRLAHVQRDVANGHELAALFAKLRQQAAVGGIDAQGQQGVVVGQVVHGGEPLPQQMQHIGAAGAAGQHEAYEKATEKFERQALFGSRRGCAGGGT